MTRRRSIFIREAPTYEPFIVFCDHCGRLLDVNRLDEPAVQEALDWLIAKDKRYDDWRVLVVRCPQHVSVWALRKAGLGRSRRWIEYFRQAKQRDDQRPKSRPGLEPFDVQATLRHYQQHNPKEINRVTEED